MVIQYAARALASWVRISSSGDSKVILDRLKVANSNILRASKTALYI